jgi:glycosyltransferase involved in cell wall biosynthesis
LVYNHEQFLKQSIESILSQKTNFDFELIIHDDASTDQSLKVINSFKSDSRVKVVSQSENLYSKGIGPNTSVVFPMAKGEYIALCEGDDFWADENKLQNQVDFLELNKNYSAVTTYTSILDRDGILTQEKIPINHVVTFRDILLDNKQQTRTVSLLFRKNCLKVETFASKGRFYAGDRKMKLVLTEMGHLIRVLPFYGAVYRHHAGGIWSLAAREKKRAAKQNDYLETHRHFSMPFFLKIRFVVHHFIKTLPGDLRYGRFMFMWQTVTALFIFPQKVVAVEK